jgi:quinol monooxygenase YgiN
MYGTVARLRIKPGAESQLAEEMAAFGARRVPGFVAEYVYRMAADPGEYYLAVVFEGEDAYRANAASPEQDAQYQRLLALCEGEPEWHDGEIVFSLGLTA